MAKLQAVENLEVTLRARRHLETGREAERTAGQIDHVLQKKHELLIQLNTNASKVMLQTSDEAAQSTPCPADVEPRIYSEPAFSSLECEVAPSTWSFLRRQPFFIRTIAQYVQRTIAAIKTCMTPAKLLAERVFCKSSKSRMRLWCSRERVVEQSIGDESHGIPRAKLRGFRVSPWEGLAELAMDNPLGDFGATMELQEHYYQLIRGVCPPRLWPLRNRRIDHTRLDMHDEYLRRRVSFENRVSMKELELLLNRWAGWMGKSLASRLWRRGMGGNAARISEEWEVV